MVPIPIVRHTVNRGDLREIHWIAQDIEDDVAGYLEIINSHPLQKISRHWVGADSAQGEQAAVWLELTDEVGDLRLTCQCIDLGKFEADVAAIERVGAKLFAHELGKIRIADRRPGYIDAVDRFLTIWGCCLTNSTNDEPPSDPERDACRALRHGGAIKINCRPKERI